MKKDSNIHIRVDSDMKKWLNILEKKYRVNQSHFIRDAILEKMKRDVQAMRKEKLTKIPF